MERHPIILRCPIVARCPIVTRKPILGKVYAPESIVNITSNYTSWEELLNTIHEFSMKKTILKIVTERSLPKEVVWAASYSEKNVIQVNINMLKYAEELDWIDRLMVLMNKCGMYCVLNLSHIVPGIVFTYNVIEILDRICRRCLFHTEIVFEGESEDVDLGGSQVKRNFLQKTAKGWRCTEEFIQAFIDKVQCFAVPKKMSVMEV